VQPQQGLLTKTQIFNKIPQVDNAPEENENANYVDHNPNWRDLVSDFNQSKLHLDSEALISYSWVLPERHSLIHSRRKFLEFPVNREILKFMSETVVLIDYSFQNLQNNVKSVWRRCRSRSIARLLNINIGSNPVTVAENWFNDIERVSLVCDYACASKVTKIYELVTSNPLFERPSKAPTVREIPTIAKITKDFLCYGWNGDLRSNHTDDFNFSVEFYQANIPFVEVIEL
jgi:hypothetical protein